MIKPGEETDAMREGRQCIECLGAIDEPLDPNAFSPFRECRACTDKQAKEDARNGLEWAWRELAANLLRVIAGAGKPYDLLANINAYIDAHNKAREAKAEHRPEESFLRDWGDKAEWPFSLDEVCRYSLRTVASELAGQRTHASTNHSELFNAIKRYTEHREEAVRQRRKNERGWA